MTGCNNFCTYCIVPYARGREQSRSVESILSEVKRMVDQGYKDITLLGQNVNSYGKTLEKPVTFTELLTKVNDVEGLERLRFLTSHPKDISDELIDAMGKLDKVCENIHLPFQAGSNSVLERMHRRYTKESYLEKIEKLKKSVPGITFSTDIIVGFPGETEEDFQDTLDVVRKVGYEQAFTFKYNRRPGTKADLFEDQVDEDVKQDRLERLLDIAYPIFYEKNKSYLGTIQEVLIEGESKNNPEVMTGRTRTFKLVNVKCDKSYIGKLVNTKIVDFNSFALTNPNDEVLIPSPYWLSYTEMCKLTDCKPVILPYNENFKVDVDILNQYKNSNTKCLILNNPSNPTGVIYSKEELLSIGN